MLIKTNYLQSPRCLNLTSIKKERYIFDNLILIFVIIILNILIYLLLLNKIANPLNIPSDIAHKNIIRIVLIGFLVFILFLLLKYLIFYNLTNTITNNNDIDKYYHQYVKIIAKYTNKIIDIHYKKILFSHQIYKFLLNVYKKHKIILSNTQYILKIIFVVILNLAFMCAFRLLFILYLNLFINGNYNESFKNRAFVQAVLLPNNNQEIFHSLTDQTNIFSIIRELVLDPFSKEGLAYYSILFFIIILYFITRTIIPFIASSLIRDGFNHFSDNKLDILSVSKFLNKINKTLRRIILAFHILFYVILIFWLIYHIYFICAISFIINSLDYTITNIKLKYSFILIAVGTFSLVFFLFCNGLIILYDLIIQLIELYFSENIIFGLYKKTRTNLKKSIANLEKLNKLAEKEDIKKKRKRIKEEIKKSKNNNVILVKNIEEYPYHLIYNIRNYSLSFLSIPEILQQINADGAVGIKYLKFLTNIDQTEINSLNSIDLMDYYRDLFHNKFSGGQKARVLIYSIIFDIKLYLNKTKNKTLIIALDNVFAALDHENIRYFFNYILKTFQSSKVIFIIRDTTGSIERILNEENN